MPLKAKKPSSSPSTKFAVKGTKTASGAAGASKKPAAKSSKKKIASFEWPPEAELGAVAIQSVFRGFQVRRDFEAKSSKKKAYDEEVSKMRQAAWVFEVELERKEEAKRRKAAETERNRKAAEFKLRKDMLEAAFDGEVDAMKTLIDRGGDPECSDNHGNTCLSEAAAGGDAATVEFLLNAGSRVDPNSKGEFGRTPLWRACFMGKTDVIPILLVAGADPRIPNETGETCGMAASSEAIRTALREWDLSRTDTVVAKFENIKLERANAEASAAQAAVGSAKSRVEAALNNHRRVQKRLKESRVELERVITVRLCELNPILKALAFNHLNLQPYTVTK